MPILRARSWHKRDFHTEQSESILTIATFFDSQRSFIQNGIGKF